MLLWTVLIAISFISLGVHILLSGLCLLIGCSVCIFHCCGSVSLDFYLGWHLLVQMQVYLCLPYS